ncbi:hypothetical protein [Alicyclobacillus herbarius]|uniref:hypothetical protein n=1 Tax=Alicyclobacillus herbarius TaxID=122960 RepID=UPI000688D9CF|nr:hypothetical protein [Alicyclobacillus herbarius]
MQGRSRGPVHRQHRFRVQTVRKRGSLWAGVAAALFLLVAFYEVYSAVNPSQSFNPLWREVTIDQTVIGDWRYGGQDPEGYLKFFQEGGGETVLLPPSARVLDLDGRFVVLEGHTASTLTFAYPLAAIPITWLVGILTAALAFLALVWQRRKALRKYRFKSVRPRPVALSRSSSRFAAAKMNAKPVRIRWRTKRWRSSPGFLPVFKGLVSFLVLPPRQTGRFRTRRARWRR